MFMRTIWSTLILSGAAASAIALAQSADQADDSDKQPQAAVTTHDFGRALAGEKRDQLYMTPMPVPGTTATYHGLPHGAAVYAARPLSAEELQQAKEFRERVEKLRRAKSDEEKTAAREQLNEMVGAQLERDLQERETKLAEIEARAKELRDQLEQRRSSKAEIQKMLMLMIESPETGLGLPPAWMSSLMQPGITTAPAYAVPYGGSLATPARVPQTTSPSPREQR